MVSGSHIGLVARGDRLVCPALGLGSRSCWAALFAREGTRCSLKQLNRQHRIVKWFLNFGIQDLGELEPELGREVV